MHDYILKSVSRINRFLIFLFFLKPRSNEVDSCKCLYVEKRVFAVVCVETTVKRKQELPESW